MNRLEFIEVKGKNKSPSTILNYNKALKKLDSYLESKGITENTLIDSLRNSDSIGLCGTMQEIIDHISMQVSPRVTKEYFEIIESYFGLNNLEMPAIQRKSRISFPRQSKRRFEGLDQTMIKRIIENESSDLMKAYYSCGFGAGMRETETLLLKPSMIRLDEDPIRLKLPKEITKFSIPRETFIAEIPGYRLKKLIYEKRIKEDSLIFCKEFNKNTLIEFEKHFAKIRSSLGMNTPNRIEHQQNDITLHSFRAFFTTVFMDNGLDWFGLAITGHTKYMDTYFRKSLVERQVTFKKVEPFLNF